MVALNESEEGLTAAELVGMTPVPDMERVAGEWLKLSVKMRLAWRIPAAVGAKTKVAVQLEAAARVVPQVLLTMEKSPGLAPSIEMLLILIADDPPLVSFTVCEAPSEPKATFCHETLVGLTNTAMTEEQPVTKETQMRRSALNRTAAATLGVRSSGKTLICLRTVCAFSAGERVRTPDKPIERLADTQGRNLHKESIVGTASPFTDVLRTY